MSEHVTATMKNGVLTLEFTRYMLELPVEEGDPNDGRYLVVHLQAPTGPSDTVPLDRIAIATAAADGIFAVPVPDPQAQTYAYYPLHLPFVAMTMNRELESQIRLLWTGPEENLALLHAQVVEEGIRFTAVRPSLAQVLASMPNLRPGTRIFVAVSAEFEHHEMRFVSEMPDDPDGRYMEITRCRKDASVRDLQVGIGIKVKAEHEDEARRALESAGFSTHKEE